MNTRLAIIRSEGKEHLCYREEECFVDVSYPMVTFTKGEDDFEIVKCDHPSMEETFLYQESRLSIVIEMYHNGWPALSLKDPVTHEIYTVLTVNLEDKAAFSLPDRAYPKLSASSSRLCQAEFPVLADSPSHLHTDGE